MELYKNYVKIFKIADRQPSTPIILCCMCCHHPNPSGYFSMSNVLWMGSHCFCQVKHFPSWTTESAGTLGSLRGEHMCSVLRVTFTIRLCAFCSLSVSDEMLTCSSIWVMVHSNCLEWYLPNTVDLNNTVIVSIKLLTLLSWGLCSICSNQHRTMAFPENKTLCVQTIQQKYNNLFKNMVLVQLDFHLQIMKLDP